MGRVALLATIQASKSMYVNDGLVLRGRQYGSTTAWLEGSSVTMAFYEGC